MDFNFSFGEISCLKNEKKIAFTRITVRIKQKKFYFYDRERKKNDKRN